MRWSWKVGSIAGIGIYVHFTFLLILAVLGYWYYQVNQDWRDAALGVGFVLLIFGIVLLHELGHAAAAWWCGIRTQDITLLPIGGAARLERMPHEPWKEILIAVAGPAVNVLLAILCLLGLLVIFIAPQFGYELSGGDLLLNLMLINLALVAFNMLPAFPMDGGRVLRAVLAMGLDYVVATQVAAVVGRVMAVAFGIYAIMTANYILVFIAIFIWGAATAEAATAKLRLILAKFTVGQIMARDFRILAPTDTVHRAAMELYQGYAHDFIVMEDLDLRGILTRQVVAQHLERNELDTPVGAVMHVQNDFAEADEILDGVVSRLQNVASHALPVLEGERLTGLLSLGDVNELLRRQMAANRRTDQVESLSEQ